MNTNKEKEMTRKIKLVLALLCVGVAVILTGCNTIHGVGKDVERGGNAIERSSGK
jgi:entericidin B